MTSWQIIGETGISGMSISLGDNDGISFGLDAKTYYNHGTSMTALNRRVSDDIKGSITRLFACKKSDSYSSVGTYAGSSSFQVGSLRSSLPRIR